MHFPSTIIACHWLRVADMVKLKNLKFSAINIPPSESESFMFVTVGPLGHCLAHLLRRGLIEDTKR